MINKNVAVFCGGNSGSQRFEELAFDLGQKLANTGFDLVFGGGNVGLMGCVARGVVYHGGVATSVSIPHFFDIEGRFCPTTGQEFVRYLCVGSMAERKRIMELWADAFVILPGGYGTLDEFFEVVTESVTKISVKPIILANYDGYYDTLLDAIDTMQEKGFIKFGPLGFVVMQNNEEIIEELIKN
jgi:uncharacterized protein (TIGR00730 family)